MQGPENPVESAVRAGSIRAASLLTRRRFLAGVSGLAATAAASPNARAAKLLSHTLEAWERYLGWADAKVERELGDANGFLIQDFLPPREREEVGKEIGERRIVPRHMQGVVPRGTSFGIRDGAIHHWWGTLLVPKTTLGLVLSFLKDYDHHSGRFIEVEQSRLLARDGEKYRFYFRLKRIKSPITVYYNTIQECTYATNGPNRASSRSVAVKIAELEYPGTPREREKAPDEDWGFLWRVVTWWRFLETGAGVRVDCESASLSRGVPTILKIIPGAMGYIESVPRESIENTLRSILTHSPRSNLKSEAESPRYLANQSESCPSVVG